MLIRFSVENFKSFKSKQSFDTLAYTRLRTKKGHITSCGKNQLNLLRLSLLYGGNASGKSNFIDAISFAKKMITGNKAINSERLFCKTDSANKDIESKFNFEISINSKYYMYGFSMTLATSVINSEWLYEIKGSNIDNQIMLFERVVKDNKLIFNKKYFTDEHNRLETYKQDYSSNKSILILDELNNNKSIDKKSSLYALVEIYNWFSRTLKIVKPNQPIVSSKYLFDSDYIERLEKFLSEFDTGIDKIEEKVTTLDDFKNDLLDEMPPEATIQVLEEMTTLFEKAEKDKNKTFSFIFRSEKGIYGVKVFDGKISIRTIVLRHFNKDFAFSLSEESDGTRRLFDLVNILLDSGKSSIYLIDELERSLHPKLTYQFLKLYLEEFKDKNIQLILTSHESCLMDQNLIRRDEVWFLERNFKGESSIFPLREFETRYDKSIDKAYLEGRYGGLPIFKTFKSKGNK